MNPLSRSRVVIACFALLSSAIAPSARAEYKCNNTYLTRVDATVCAKAREGGATEVRRYLWRTRMIHNLLMSDYWRFELDGPKTQPAHAAQDSQGSVAGAVPGNAATRG